MFTANADRVGRPVGCVGADVYCQATNTTPTINPWRREPCWRLLPIQRARVKITPDVLTRRRTSLGCRRTGNPLTVKFARNEHRRERSGCRACGIGVAGGAHVTRAGLRIEFAPWTRRCGVCAADFRVTDARPECSACGSGDTETAGGDQMELSLLELEET
jgi:hypothetical protein